MLSNSSSSMAVWIHYVLFVVLHFLTKIGRILQLRGHIFSLNSGLLFL